MKQIYLDNEPTPFYITEVGCLFVTVQKQEEKL